MDITIVDEKLKPEDRTLAEATWEKIRRHWNLRGHVPVPRFMEIEFNANECGHPQFRRPGETTDWLRNDYVEQYRNSLLNYRGSYLEGTRKGTLHTANLLFEALRASEAEPDLVTAVWVAAWCENFDQDRHQREGWRFEHHMAVNEVMTAARNHLAHSPTFAKSIMPDWWGIWWHHSMREVLPGAPPVDMFVPTEDVSGITDIIAVSATVSMATHTLIHIKAN